MYAVDFIEEQQVAYRRTVPYRGVLVRFMTKTRIVYRTVPPSLEGVRWYARCTEDWDSKINVDMYYEQRNILHIEAASAESKNWRCK